MPIVEVDPLPTSAPAGADATTALWHRLARPFDTISTVSALTGLSHAVVAQVVGAAVAGSDEASDLLDQFPRTVRMLATSMQVHNERCKGELRGPVLWSETMSARASSFGDPDLYVCMTPSRAYDIDENRILVWALAQIRDAARDATENTPTRHQDDPLVRAIKRNGNDAGRFLEHPSLRNVARVRPNPRGIKRVRGGRKNEVYAPALAMIARAADPLDAETVRGWCDRRTRLQHAVLMGITERLERTGNRLPDFRVERGALYAGPVQYHHGRVLGDRTALSGVVVGPLLVDVPDRLADPDRGRAEATLRARAAGRPCAVIMEEADLDRAVAQAIEIVRGRAGSG